MIYILSYRNDVTPAKSAGVGFGSRMRSIAVTLTYLDRLNNENRIRNGKTVVEVVIAFEIVLSHSVT